VPFATSTAVTSPDISAARGAPAKVNKIKAITKIDTAGFMDPPPLMI
jgi:hypothetical protein